MADTLNAGEAASAEQAAVLNSSTQQNISQTRQAQLDAATALLVRNAASRSTGSPTSSDLNAVNVFTKPDGTLVIITQSGKEFTANKEEQEYFNEQENQNILKVREQYSEIETFKAWAKEQGVFKLGQTDAITTIAELERDPSFANFRDYANQQLNKTGSLPYATPYKDYLAQTAIQDTTVADTPRTKYPSSTVADPFINTGRQATGSAALAGDELAALKRAIGTNANQEQVNRSVGLAPITPAMQAARFAAQRANDSLRYGGEESGETFIPDNYSAADEEARTNLAMMAALNQMDQTDTSNGLQRKVALRPNPLDEYESYSYTISLHVLTEDEYNTMVSNDRTESFVPTHTLISGAGFRDSGFGTEAGPTMRESSANRAQGWEDNFFFDNLKLSSVIGLNETSRGTNVIDVSFTIIEPYGLSLIDRLIATTDTLGSPGLYFQNCYLLEVNFYASGVGKLHDMKKFIPIQIRGMSVKASARGSEYRIEAQPFSHNALAQSRASTPANFEVNAGTLEEFFQGEDSSSASTASLGAREAEQLRAALDNKSTARKVDQDKAATLSNKVYAVNSYVAAYNQWQQTLIDLKVTNLTKPNKISVVFDDVFLQSGGSKVYRPRDQDGTVGSSAMARGNDAKNGDNVRAEATKDRFSFAAGTQVTEVINIAMKQSEFIRRQIVLQDQAKAGGAKEVQGKVTWWKIIPKVKLQEFDTKSNQWSFDTTFYVVPYEIWNTVHPSLPMAVPDRGICSKEYQYYYTGQNTSVIDFNIDFDLMYFTKVLALKEKNTDDGYKDELEEGVDESTRKKSKGKGVNPGVITHVSDDPKTAGQKTRGDPTAMAIADVSQSIYSSAAGEMLNITMKIVGDPELIKQDDVFTGVNSTLNQGISQQQVDTSAQSTTLEQSRSDLGVANNNNSLVMDNAEVVCWVEIKTPVDVDDLTGGVRYLDNNKVKSGFTGVYKLLMVDSEFNKGQFTQTLNLIRYMNQDVKEDTSYDDAEMKRFSNYTANNVDQPAEAINNPSQVIINDLTMGTEESDLVKVTPIAPPPTFTATQLPGGLVQYNYTVGN